MAGEKPGYMGALPHAQERSGFEILSSIKASLNSGASLDLQRLDIRR